MSVLDELGMTETGKVNTQLWEESSLRGSDADVAARENPDALYRARDPNLAVISEKPEHRIMCYLKAQGKSNNEIAELVHRTPPWVSQVLRQPWARDRILTIIKESGKDAVDVLLQSTTVDSVVRLIEERDNPKAKPAERINAANALLDRALGKAVQRVESHNTNEHINLTVSDLVAQDRALSEQLKAHGISG